MPYLHILNKIPKKVSIALSGGVDSMVCLDFLLKGGREVTALHFNHGTAQSDEYEKFVVNQCSKHNVKIIIGRLNEEVPPRRSKEDFWREKRYDFFKNQKCGSLITCHHLDDAVETWVFSSLKGTSKILPYKRDFVIRPFLLNKKSALLEWAEHNSVSYIQDLSNLENNFARNYIRNIMMPHVLNINPGIHKNVKKKIIAKYL